MKPSKAYIVGGGLFGSIAATALIDMGYDVTIIDCGKKIAGSKPAACLMKPSWMTSLDYKPPLKFLDKHFGVETVKFKVGLLSTDCSWVNPKSILLAHDKVDEQVIEVKDGTVVTNESTYHGLIVVAAGIWAQKLLPSIPEVRALCGSAVKSPGTVNTPTINPYAPYRQAVWFNVDKDTQWFGDGTAILKKNFSKDHTDRTTERAKSLANIEGTLISGARPYMKGFNAGFFEKLGDNLYVTGSGAKNGTIVGANNALRLMAALGKK